MFETTFNVMSSNQFLILADKFYKQCFTLSKESFLTVLYVAA